MCCAAAFEGDCSYEQCASTEKERHGNGFEEFAWWWLVVMMHSSSGGGGGQWWWVHSDGGRAGGWRLGGVALSIVPH